VTLLSEYGVMGLALWVSLFAAAIIFAYRTLVKAETAEEKLAVPLIAALGTMMVTRYVSSSPEILPLAFMLLALSVALQYRMLQKSAVPAAVSVAPAVRRRIPRFAPPAGLPEPAAGRR
jgi:O-antigen ligase